MKVLTLQGALAVTILAVTPLLTWAQQGHAATGQVDTIHRAGVINGMQVKSTDNQDLGEVDDVVIDVSTGKVHYLAVSSGGVLGVGDKLFAVPAGAFQVRRGVDADEYYLTLDIDQNTLRSAPSFSQNNWPDFSNPAWCEKMDRYYSNYKSSSKIDQRSGQKNTIYRASKISGMTVKNESNKELGEVHDVVIDLADATVKYLAVSYGGILGIGDKLFAVPFNAFECRQGDQENEYFLVTNIDKQTLENAPGFDQDHWPNFADSRWSDENDNHYRNQDRRAQLN